MKISVRDIAKAFGDETALDDVSLDIASGELIALLGPSGSGKTTLLRLIAGLEFPSSGKIFFGDDDALMKSVQERNVGFVFQHYALFRHMSVADNVGFGLRVRGASRRPSRAAIRQRAAELLDLVQLPGLGHRYPQQLSGGQRQRVALARALAIDPQVLLLDEPFGALDAKVRKDLRRWLRTLHDQTGHTTVFVTHDQEEALELADRVVVMSKGRIEQIGAADDIYDRPASPFVFSFIGQSNELPVTVHAGEIAFEGTILGRTDEADGERRMFTRPHDFDVVPAGTLGLAGTISLTRRSGGSRVVEFVLPQGERRIEVELPADHGGEVGEPIAVRPRKWRLFPKAA